MIVIGITGKNSAGKDAVADILEQTHGFERHSLSDALRHELRARGEVITREAMIRLGNELRRLEGAAVLAERMKRLIQRERVTLVSVRSPSEVRSLRELDGFRLLAVAAPVALRFKRERSRNRESAVQTLEAFVELEERENTRDPNAQQLDETIALADHYILNDGTLEDLEAEVLALLDDING